MKKIKRIIICLLLIGYMAEEIQADTITIVDASGNAVEVNIDASDTFLDVIQWAHMYLQDQAIRVEIESTENHSHSKKITVRTETIFRNYEAGYTQEDKNNISQVLNILANQSLLKLKKQLPHLKETMKKFEYLHPFRFLECIFLDKGLKASIKAIQARGGIIRNKFYENIINVLNAESDKDNLVQYVENFSRKLDLKEKDILIYVQDNQWKGLIDHLIDKLS